MSASKERPRRGGRAAGQIHRTFAKLAHRGHAPLEQIQHDPVRLAEEALMVDHLSRGRLEVGAPPHTATTSRGWAAASSRWTWGRAVVENLARDLRAEFPGVGGFSAANLWRIRQFYEAYANGEKLAPMVREISWTKNLAILERCKESAERQFYLERTNSSDGPRTS